MDNCFFHDNNKAKRQCGNCGKMFCAECDDLTNESGLCLACWKTKLKKDMTKLKNDKASKTTSVFYWGISTLIMIVVAFAFPAEIYSWAMLVGFIGAGISLIVCSYNLYMMLKFKKALVSTEKELNSINNEMQKILAETYKK